MSDSYRPITQELRAAMNLVGCANSESYILDVTLDIEGFEALCDDIDALHKSLEEQNAKLHEKVLNQRKQLADVQEAIERRNNGVLKRRWQKKMDALKNENEEMRDFNCRVREAILRHEDLTLWGTDYMALPLDADGVPIHFGDVLDQFGTPMTVWAMSDHDPNQGDCMLELITDGISDGTWVRARKMRHYHKPTVEDVLLKFYTLAVRGKEAHAEDVDGNVLAEYAAKLRLAGDAE